MTHVWNDHYGTLYDRTYQVLYDAGVDEKLARQLAARRTLAAAFASNASSNVRMRPHRPTPLCQAFFQRLFVKQPLYEQPF